jgi:hypothetical protein
VFSRTKGADAMNWMRGNRRIGAWWGPPALARQFILSFGHAATVTRDA